MQAKTKHKIKNNFLLFVNCGSGGGIGQQMLDQQVQIITYNLQINKEYEKVSVRMFNMRNNQSRQKGFTLLKNLSEENKKTKYQAVAIVCGGDGSVMWVVSELKKYQIDIFNTPIAVLPLGTGNDFSRALNWGKSTDRWNLSQLKIMVERWIESQQQQFDLWDMQAQVFEDGKFTKYEKEKDVTIPGNILKKTFCNYFSFGIDGKIGYSFDKYRTNNRIGNLAVYGAVGAMNQISKNYTIDYLVEHLYVTLKPDTKDNQYIQFGHCLFESQDIVNKWHPLMNILALNIDSYTGGTTGIWDRGKELFKKQEIRSPPQSSDGKIQLVAFDSGISIAMQKSIGGLASRITQGQGPYRFQFKRYQKKDHQTYLQIDGQFIKMIHPKYVILRKSQMFPNGKIKVLRNLSTAPNLWQQITKQNPIEQFFKK